MAAASRARTPRSASAWAATRACRPDDYTPIVFARNLLPLVQLPPAGFWRDRRRPTFVLDPRPLPDPADAAALVLERYLGAFGPASMRDAAAWAGVAQRDFAEALGARSTRSPTATRTAPSCSTCPARRCRPRARGCRCAAWHAGTRSLLAYADRDRIIPPELAPLKLDAERRPDDHGRRPRGRLLAARARDAAGQVVVEPHVDIRRSAHARSAPRPSAPRASPSPRRRAWRSPGCRPGGVCSTR